MKKTFCIGDRVVGTGTQDGVDLTGMIGTIKGEAEGYDGYTVEFDEHRNGFHSGIGGNCKSGHGWNCNRRVLELYDDGVEWDQDLPPVSGLFMEV